MPSSSRRPAPESRPTAAEHVAKWIDEYGDAVYAYARQRVDLEQVAEELVQETFVAALENFDQFAGRSSPKTWLIAILRNKVVNYYRTRSRRRQQPMDPDVGEQMFDAKGIWKISIGNWPRRPDQAFQDREFWQVFDRCLGNLPASAADVFVLRVFDQMDSERICKTLGISSTNLAVRLHRARMALRNCLEKNWFGGD